MYIEKFEDFHIFIEDLNISIEANVKSNRVV